jgi:hypothetical protein
MHLDRPYRHMCRCFDRRQDRLTRQLMAAHAARNQFDVVVGSFDSKDARIATPLLTSCSTANHWRCPGQLRDAVRNQTPISPVERIARAGRKFLTSEPNGAAPSGAANPVVASGASLECPMFECALGWRQRATVPLCCFVLGTTYVTPAKGINRTSIFNGTKGNAIKGVQQDERPDWTASKPHDFVTFCPCF